VPSAVSVKDLPRHGLPAGVASPMYGPCVTGAAGAHRTAVARRAGARINDLIVMRWCSVRNEEKKNPMMRREEVRDRDPVIESFL